MLRFFERISTTGSSKDGQPLHIADPSSSGFAIVSADTFHGMSPKELQELLQRKNVIVPGSKVPQLQFNEEGLRTLASLDTPVSLQGKIFVDMM